MNHFSYLYLTSTPKTTEVSIWRYPVFFFRIFAGMTNAESAFVLKVSERTIEDDWRMAKMWLFHELSAGTE